MNSPSLALGRVLREHAAPVHSIDFTKDGELMLTAASDGRVCLYDCQLGVLKRASQCRTHSVGRARLTHDPLTAVVAVGEEGSHDDSPTSVGALRYLSLHDNQYLRAFLGHTASVCSLDMSPKDDWFASAAADDTARMWDVRVERCQGVLSFEGPQRSLRPALSFDPHGLVLAAALCGGLVKLFDVRALQKGPFTTFDLQQIGGKIGFANINFNYDGALMALGTSAGVVLVLDAFNGEVLRQFRGHVNDQGVPLEACFSPDSTQVLCGSEDGSVWRWALGQEQPQANALAEAQLTPQHLPPLTGDLTRHSEAVRVVRSNPTRTLVASACSSIFLWLQAN
uniref:Anaphase-promoting complex subunit 4 WD40 domain-containing protein n=1 Tax=Calcidiscus leptoporus TaxID=127549 RepID=A0A7S0P5K6_9EUKA|mmetsp:Transcript_57588/g.132263  ORF Transcript_57588/g.132263 Transcript_57588/m.132263 type:complete len:339 (+) Transcript_57588:54-1070(+)